MAIEVIKKEMLQLMEDYQRLKERDPWQFFDPLPKQAQFQWYVGQRFQVVFFAGGNWTGKTITGANTAVQLAMTGCIQTWDVKPILNVDGSFSKWERKRGPLLQVCPVPNMGRIGTEKELVEKDVVRNLKMMLHYDSFNTEKKMRPFESQWYFPNRSEFDIMTYDQAKKQWEGVELNWVWLNEPSTEDIFTACLGRFKKGGVLFLTATTLGCGWVVDLILDANNPRFKVVEMNTYDNAQSKGGFLPDDKIDEMLAAQDSEYREARKTGRPLSLSGRVFKNYDEAKFFVEMASDAPDNAMVMMATDPHDKIPAYSAWGYMGEDDRLYIYREHPSEDFWEYHSNPWTNEDELALLYKEIEDVEPARRLLDKKFGQTTKFGNKLTVKEMLYQAGLVYEDWDGSSLTAHNMKIRTWIDQGKIQISKNCPNMNKALKRHRFLDQTSARAKDEKGQREQVDDKFRHQIDTIAALIEACDDGVIQADVVSFERIGRSEDEQDRRRTRRLGAEAVYGKGVVMAEEEEGEEDGYFSWGELF